MNYSFTLWLSLHQLVVVFAVLPIVTKENEQWKWTDITENQFDHITTYHQQGVLKHEIVSTRVPSSGHNLEK